MLPSHVPDHCGAVLVGEWQLAFLPLAVSTRGRCVCGSVVGCVRAVQVRPRSRASGRTLAAQCGSWLVGG
eukprot:9138526-Heterocapsa_arctica.AAC.1